MAREYAERGVNFIFVYTREAHPGEKFGHLTSIEQKLDHARRMIEAHSIARPMLVDDLEGTIHTAYGRLPNMTYIVEGGGRIAYRASWTDAANLRMVLDQIVGWRAARREGAALRPYYVEWQANVTADRITFVDTLLRDVGPRAVGEYIAAVDNVMGAGVAGPLQQWWSEKQAAPKP